MDIRSPHGDEAHGADASHGSDSMAAEEGGHTHGSDGHGGGGHEMMVIFHNVMETSLFSESWTPSNAGTYAATCLFLIFLAATMRCLVAAKSILEQRWLDHELQRRYVVVDDKNPLGKQLSTDSLAKPMTLSENGREENVTVVQRKKGLARPWRFSVDPVRALVDTIIAGVGYLL